MPGKAGFREQLARAMRPYPAKGRYVIGVSGGRDSVALLRTLAELGYARLLVAHLDHGLRGTAARQDARFVARLAKELGLTFETARLDVARRAKEAKLSMEEAARNARLTFLAEVSARNRCRTILLAHHADDQVETFLFNLLRGAGPAGLAGMRLESWQNLGRRKLRFVRPMLGIWRAQIDAFLGERGWTWREDATNANPAYATRNRLRLEALPALCQAMGRDVRAAIWRAADVLAAEEDWLNEILLASVPTRLPVVALRASPIAKQRRMLRAWLAKHGAHRIGYQEIELLRGLLETGPDTHAKVNLPGDRHVRRRAGVLFLEAPTLRAHR